MNSRGASPDPATVEIVRNDLIDIGEEMQAVVMNSAYSVLWQEAGDLSCAVLDPSAEVVGQSERAIPVHVASLRNTVRACLDATGGIDALSQGDVFIQNDPYRGGLHLPDVAIAAPVFVDGTLLGFSAVRGHWVDVGGSTPTSYTLEPDAEIIQEGVRIPPAKLYEGGTLNDALLETILANTRDRDERRGDLDAQIAGVKRGVSRFEDLASKYGLDTVGGSIERILGNDENRMRNRIADLEDGYYSASDYIEGGDVVDGLLEIAVGIEIDGEDARVDFDGTADQVDAGLNSTWSSTQASVHYAFRVTLDPGTPGTLGGYRPIEVTAAEGSLVNPVYPAPVVAQAAAGNRIYDTVVRAIANIDPELAFAGGEGSANVFSYESLRTGKLNYTCMAGGAGACPARDGINGIRSARANTSVQPIERVEEDYPFVRIEEYAIAQDSGGAGRNRGGNAARRTTRFSEDAFVILAADRGKTQPFGLVGGHPGESASHVGHTGDGAAEELPSKMMQTVEAGFALEFQAAAGGGYGDPLTRDPQRVAEDVANDYVSVEAAREEYGVVIDPDTGDVDDEATAAIRGGT